MGRCLWVLTLALAAAEIGAGPRSTNFGSAIRALSPCIYWETSIGIRLRGGRGEWEGSWEGDARRDEMGQSRDRYGYGEPGRAGDWREAASQQMPRGADLSARGTDPMAREDFGDRRGMDPMPRGMDPMGQGKNSMGRGADPMPRGMNARFSDPVARGGNLRGTYPPVAAPQDAEDWRMRNGGMNKPYDGWRDVPSAAGGRVDDWGGGRAVWGGGKGDASGMRGVCFLCVFSEPRCNAV